MQRHSLRRITERGLYGALVGGGYALLNFGWEISLLLLFIAIGFSIGFLTGLTDRWLYLTRLRRQPFIVILLVRTLAYLIGISLTLT